VERGDAGSGPPGNGVPTGHRGEDRTLGWGRVIGEGRGGRDLGAPPARGREGIGTAGLAEKKKTRRKKKWIFNT
jgi:hypothetical protein